MGVGGSHRTRCSEQGADECRTLFLVPALGEYLFELIDDQYQTRRAESRFRRSASSTLPVKPPLVSEQCLTY
jgi:hypothetical protein